MKTTKSCPTCGVEFTRVHAQAKPPTYCSRACANKAPGRMTPEIRAKIGRPSTRNKGGWMLKVGDYRQWRLWVSPDERHLHPTLDKHGYIARSHYVWNQAHPDDLVQRGEVVHHINHDSLDDRIENLEKLPSQREHMNHHAPVIAATRIRDSRGRFL